MKFTVYYDGQFWVGVVEEFVGGKLKAGRFVFGSEPNDYEILEFVHRHIVHLTNQLSQEVEAKTLPERRVNPKRLARLAAREMSNKGVSSYAQEALKLELEKRKREKRILSRQQKEEMKERKRQIKRQKAKEKHRGR